MTHNDDQAFTAGAKRAQMLEIQERSLARRS